MKTPDDICEATQQEICAALDENRAIPQAALGHARQCAECAAFRSAWESSLPALLAAPLPVAGVALRESVLALPRRVQSDRARRWRSSSISALAAALVLGVFGYAFIDIRPTPVREQASQSPASEEIAALKSDFRRGLDAMRGPAGALQNVLGR